MHADVSRVLASLEERAAREYEEIVGLDGARLEARRDDFVLPIGAEVGRLLHAIITSAKARRIVEIGTCRGYSTLWLADAARLTDGRVTSFEKDARKLAEARANLEAAGLATWVELRLGDAVDGIANLEPGVELVLIDLWKDLYIPCLDAIFPKLAPGALVIADNMLFPLLSRSDAENYRRHVRAKGEMESVLLPLGSGIEVSRRVG